MRRALPLVLLALPALGAEWKLAWPDEFMGNVGCEPDAIHASIHTFAYTHSQKTGKGAKTEAPGPSRGFHVYAVEWDAQRMDFSVDGRRYFTYENEKSGEAAWPFDRPVYLILNSAIGGSWGGRNGVDDASFPQRFEIGSVRVYEKN